MNRRSLIAGLAALPALAANAAFGHERGAFALADGGCVTGERGSEMIIARGEAILPARKGLDIAHLGIKVDTSGVKAAIADIERLGALAGEKNVTVNIKVA